MTGRARSVAHTRAFDLDRPVDELFPLFSPEGERHWIPGWDYENVMGTTQLAEGYVFLTRAHDHGTTQAIWVVSRYEPEAHRVRFHKVEAGDKVGTVTVECTALAPSRTRVQVTYEYVALSPEGEAFVAGFDAETYRAFIDEWQSLLTRHFAAGGGGG